MANQPRRDTQAAARITSTARYDRRGGGLLGSSFNSLVALVAVQVLTAMAVLFLNKNESALQRALPFLISVAIGVLFATGVVHLLPEAVERLGNGSAVWIVVVGTVLAMFAFERTVQMVSGVPFEPTATVECASHSTLHQHHHAARPTTLVLGSVMHSLVDGTSVAAAFTVDAHVGWVTALAVGLHEIPHRLGDFALLAHMGVGRTRAALLAIAAGGSSLAGWALVAALGARGSDKVTWLLPVSAGSFLYISLVDLLPELREERRPLIVLGQIVCLAAGIVIAIGLTRIPGA
jgi:zinc and cadmium transporter